MSLSEERKIISVATVCVKVGYSSTVYYSTSKYDMTHVRFLKFLYSWYEMSTSLFLSPWHDASSCDKNDTTRNPRETSLTKSTVKSSRSSVITSLSSASSCRQQHASPTPLSPKPVMMIVEVGWCWWQPSMTKNFIPGLRTLQEDIRDGMGRKLRGSSSSTLKRASTWNWHPWSYTRKEWSIKLFHYMSFVIISIRRNAVGWRVLTGRPSEAKRISVVSPTIMVGTGTVLVLSQAGDKAYSDSSDGVFA